MSGKKLKKAKDTPSILHIGSTANIPQTIRDAQRRMGMESDVLDFDQHPFGYDIDIYKPLRISPHVHPAKGFRYLVSGIEKTLNTYASYKDYDIIHLHVPPLLPGALDLPIWKTGGKHLIVHHHGSDVRYKKSPWLCRKLADNLFVSTPDLLEWVPEAIWLPNPIDLEKYEFTGVAPHGEHEKMTIVHAPSDRAKKGTDEIVSAIKKLSEKYRIDFKLVEGLPHKLAVEEFRRADLIIDQIKLGIYSMVSVEGMALGKAVACNIREDLWDYYKNCPIIDVKPTSLVEDLSYVLEDPDFLTECGVKSRQYVERMHDSMRIVQMLMGYYRS